MSDETFTELMESAEQALQYERGERGGHRVTRVAVPQPLAADIECGDRGQTHTAESLPIQTDTLGKQEPQ